MNRILVGAAVLLVSCGISAEDRKIETMTAQAVHQSLLAEGAKPLVVDVREPDEFEAGHIREALLAPLANVEKDLASVPKDREIVLVCRSGRRSRIAAKMLSERGYTKLWNMEGGMLAWQKLGYPVVKKD
jgi:phage shock protein E